MRLLLTMFLAALATVLPIAACAAPVTLPVANDAGGNSYLSTPTVNALAIVPVTSPSAEGSRVIKSSAGNLYRIAVTTGAAAGYIMIFNATSAPADGTVSPAMCRAVGATSSLSITFEGAAAAYTTGIVAVFSSTGCFSKTISNTAYFEAYAQ